jgi:glycosyltransferase-like protein
MADMHPAPVALVTYSTRPRGGVAHTLALGEALHAMGHPVLIVGLGDPDAGFFRPVAAPVHVITAPVTNGDLETKVYANIGALEVGLGEIAGDFPLLHTQDCISARAAVRVRTAGAPVQVVRTVHHVDDFTSAVLMNCQRQAILEPDLILVVSEVWRRIMDEEYGVTAHTVTNGVDIGRYANPQPDLPAALRERVGATGRPLLRSVGGIEPRKGSDTLIEAMGVLHGRMDPPPVLAVIGGHSFQDHREYRNRVLDSMGPNGLQLGVDVVEVGSVPEAEIPAWYAAADALAFPSVKEGFGLAALEAMSAGLPVVTSDLPVFREWLTADRDALLVPVGQPQVLADALQRVLSDTALRTRLTSAGRSVAQRFSWAASARTHLSLYETLSVSPSMS